MYEFWGLAVEKFSLLPHGGRAREKIYIRMLVSLKFGSLKIFKLGSLKFGQISFFCVGKVLSYFFGFRKTSAIFLGLTNSQLFSGVFKFLCQTIEYFE